MELKTYFGVNEILKESNSEKIYGICNEKIRSLQLSPIKMIKNSNVKLICTTDDPADTLEYHMLFKMKHKADLKVLPTFRPDKALNILSQDYKKYIEKLSLVSNQNIKTYDDLVEVLMKRIQYFSKVGCVLSDHSLESLSYMPVVKADEVEDIFTRRMLGEPVSAEDADKFRYHSLKLLAQEYKKKGWVMQLHIGAMRNLNKTKFRKLGADAGFDIMNDFQIAESLTELLNTMDELNSLPKTVLYALNSKDNLVLSSIPHCFTEDGIPGKVQFGAAWWFMDNKEGIRSHLKSIASQGMLPYFIGMLTDSRSFLSYVRHDYFRRILCSYIGELVDKGEFENDESILKEIVEGICFTNIKSYLSLEGNQ
jgi:glucuronate isomerase